MDQQRDNSTGGDFNGRILEAIASLERRVSALSACERQPLRIDRVVPAPVFGGVPTFSKPGHADQFKFCEEVKTIATTALASFRFDEDDQRWLPEVGDDEPLDNAVEALHRIVAAIESREKLIKMADRSELGWRVVQHYVADPIADSLDDEKRIKNAAKSAAAELKAAQEKKG